MKPSRRKLTSYICAFIIVAINIAMFFEYRAYNNPNYNVVNLIFWFAIAGIFIVDPEAKYNPKFSWAYMIKVTLMAIGCFCLGIIFSRVGW